MMAPPVAPPLRRALLLAGLAWLAGCLSAVSALPPPAGSLPTASARFPLAPEALGLMFQVVTKLQEHVRTGDLVSLHTEDVILQAGLGALGQQSSFIPPERREEFQKAVAEFGQHVGALHLAGDLGRQPEATTELEHVQSSFATIQAFFPPAVVATGRAAAEAFACPSHPDVHGKREETCPKCGQPLEQQVRLLPEFCGFPLSNGPSVSATVRVDHPLLLGEPVKATLQLRRASNGNPVYPSELIVTHTERVHLLLVDSTLSDYQHTHPRHTQVPGEYSFTFTPRRPGPYRVWADLRPQPMGLQEYSATVIQGLPGPRGPVDRSATNRVTVDGFTFELLVPQERVRFARPNLVRLRVTGPDGSPCRRLEPFMSAYAHLVGFYEEGRGVVHVHPKGPAIHDRTARGGPELEFQFYTTQRGFLRFFAQVQIEGTSHFAPFGVHVGP